MNTRERFDTSFSVASYETDLTGKLSLFALFNRFQDLAGLHADSLNVGHKQLRELNLAWILSRMRVEISSLPKWSDTVQLATWPKGVDRLFAMRDFSLSNEEGEKLVLATSAWLLVDIVKNRPQRIENLPVDLQFRGAPQAITEIPDKIFMPEGMRTMFERPVVLSDIDINRHVNNAQYVKWIGDSFSEEQYRSHRVKSLQINYLEETLLGNTIALLKSPEDDQAGEYFLSGVNRAKGSTVFHARVAWN
jgi:acyl-ACP thioesterase